MSLRSSGAAVQRRSALTLAIGLVTATAVLLHLGELRLEAVEVRDLPLRRLGLVGELGQPGLEVGLVLPDGRQCRGVAAGLGILGKQRVRLGNILVGGENLL